MTTKGNTAHSADNEADHDEGRARPRRPRRILWIAGTLCAAALAAAAVAIVFVNLPGGYSSPVAEAAAHHNACGAGALAATVAACQASGATQGILLDYYTSADVESGRRLFGGGRPQDAVGYAGVVFAQKV